jgi:copper chaperone CopZ
MTCGACERRVQRALAAVPGVRAARVDLASATVAVTASPETATDALRRAVAAAGYLLDDAVAAPGSSPLLRAVAFGALAAGGLLAFYLGTITLAQGWTHAAQQLADDRWFVLAITSGFGTQVGLFAARRSRPAASRRAPARARPRCWPAAPTT